MLFLQAEEQQLLFTEQVQRQFFLYVCLWAQIQYFLALKPRSVSQSCPNAITQGKQSQEPQNLALRQQPDIGPAPAPGNPVTADQGKTPEALATSTQVTPRFRNR